MGCRHLARPAASGHLTEAKKCRRRNPSSARGNQGQRYPGPSLLLAPEQMRGPPIGQPNQKPESKEPGYAAVHWDMGSPLASVSPPAKWVCAAGQDGGEDRVRQPSQMPEEPFGTKSPWAQKGSQACFPTAGSPAPGSVPGTR